MEIKKLDNSSYLNLTKNDFSEVRIQFLNCGEDLCKKISTFNFCRIAWNTWHPRFAMTQDGTPDLTTIEGYMIQSFIGIFQRTISFSLLFKLNVARKVQPKTCRK
jgi:hypothetical protein